MVCMSVWAHTHTHTHTHSHTQGEGVYVGVGVLNPLESIRLVCPLTSLTVPVLLVCVFSNVSSLFYSCVCSLTSPPCSTRVCLL